MALAVALGGNTVLRTLMLGGNAVGDAGATALAEAGGAGDQRDAGDA